MNRVAGVTDGIKDRFFDLTEAIFGQRIALFNHERDWIGLLNYLTGPATAAIGGWQDADRRGYQDRTWKRLGFTIRETEAVTSSGLAESELQPSASALTEFRRLMGEYGVAVPSDELPDILRTLGLDCQLRAYRHDQQWGRSGKPLDGLDAGIHHHV